MNKIILKTRLLLVALGSFSLLLGQTALANNECLPQGYSIISINGMLTTAKGAVYNKNMLSGALKIKNYNNQKVVYDYVYNPTHGFLPDFVDAMIQKTGERIGVSDTHDLKNMLVDLSKKVKTQKLLFVAHSQGNFYANDIYRILGDKEGGISKSSMGIYGIGTPTSYMAGGGKYILSKNDSIINKIRLYGVIDVLPANVDIEDNPEDEFNGHGLSDTYLKYENKRISAEILTMLHELEEDPMQDPSKICIDEPEITILDEMIDLAYKIMDPIQETATGTVKLFVDNLVEPTLGTLAKMGRGYMKFVNGLFATSGNSLSQTNKGLVETESNDEIDQEEFVYDEELFESDNHQEENQNSITGDLIFAFDDNGEDENIKNDNELDSNIKIPSRPHSHNSHNQNQENDDGENNNEDAGLNDDQNDDTTSPEENDDLDDDNTEEDESGDTDDETDDTDDDDINDNTNNPPIVPGDTVSPVIFLNGEENMRISNGSEYLEAGATANDYVDGAVEVEIIGSVDATTSGIYTITYKAVDKAGNQATKERKVEVYTPLPGFFVDENTELPAGEYFFENVTITNNATLTLLSDTISTTNNFRGVKINATNLTVDSGSMISADNQGFIIGPGTMTDNRSGGSYGGKGDTAEEGYVYGSAIYPKDLGSGGAIQREYYKGGGAIWLEVSDTITNNGIISANGGQSSSGGSVYVNTKNLDGSGIFRANGGGLASTSIFYFPGGGGRTAIHYDNSSFTGDVEANYGSGYVGYPNPNVGEGGTAGLLDKKNNILYIDNDWEFTVEDSPFAIDKIVTKGMAKVRFQEDAEINVGEFIVDESSELILTGEEIMSINNLEFRDSSWASIPTEKILKITADNLFIDETSRISAESKGSMYGPGTPLSEHWSTTGASYGGKGGGVNAKDKYGDEKIPLDFGSGTEGFNGGGVVRLEIAEVLENNGTITADGYWRRTSGGSIYIKTNTLSGNGNIFARGGNGISCDSWACNIAGGGGRIAVYYHENNFIGNISANAGDFCCYGCAPGGEHGTVFLVDEDTVPIKSSENNILSFSFEELNPVVGGLINSESNVITATVPDDTNITALVPTITISSLATLDKASLSPQDFSNPVTYTVTAENGQTKTYTVTIKKESDLSIPIDDIDPVIISYSMNATTEDLVIDPGDENVVIEMTASENIDWVSIEIEKIDNTSIRKLYLSGENCEDGTNHCTKIWRGELSGAGTILEEGDYRVNVHIKDEANNETFYVLPSLIKVIKIDDSQYEEIMI